MALSWFSPLDADRTEIARYSEQILPLVSTYIPVVEVSDCSGEPTHSAWFDEVCTAGLEGVPSMPIYHLGNNPLHVDIVEAMQEKPGIVVLHDICLIDLAKGCTPRLSWFNWLDALGEIYGHEALMLGRESERSSTLYEHLVTRYPLFQPFIANAKGVVVHSEYARKFVEPYFEGPILKLDLPYPATITSKPSYEVNKFKLLFCGYVGPNRRLEELLAAWGKLSAPEKFELHLFGNVGNEKKLKLAAEQAGVLKWVKIRGYVDNDTLQEAISESHLAINLRYPTMGETSASQLRYWDNALPSLVSNIGWYAEVPSNTVIRISLDNEASDIEAALQGILDNSSSFAEVGLAGRSYLKTRHNPDIYAKALADFVVEVRDNHFYHTTLVTGVGAIISDMCADESMVKIFEPAVDILVDTIIPEN